MGYVISIIVLAAVMTVWGHFFSKWKAGRGGGGCGCCSAFGDNSVCQSRRSGENASCPESTPDTE